MLWWKMSNIPSQIKILINNKLKDEYILVLNFTFYIINLVTQAHIINLTYQKLSFKVYITQDTF